MKRLALVTLLALAAAFAQAESEAKKVQESTGVTEHGSEVLWGWLNFVLLVGGLGYLVKKNGGPYFARRSLAIRKGMIEAQELQAQADAQVAEVEKCLSNLQAEIEVLRRTAQLEAESEVARVRGEGEAELAKIRMHLSEEVAAAGKSARLELRRYSAALALRLAEQKIAARISPLAQEQLVERFVGALAEVPAPSR
jgi:F-type H+-transporting ATPase subunit b